MPIFPSVFLYLFFDFLLCSACVINCVISVFQFVNSFKFFSKQVNVTEVEVSVEIEQ